MRLFLRTLRFFYLKNRIGDIQTNFGLRGYNPSIGELVKVPTPETFCAKMGTKYRALIRFFLKVQGNKILGSLNHGGDLILVNHPDFDRTKGKGITFISFRRFLKVREGSDLFQNFLQIIVFDALIGNTDRHQDNWGFVLEDRKITGLTPAFDNSDSLGREIEEKKSGFLRKQWTEVKKICC